MSCLDIVTIASMYAAAVPLIRYNTTISTTQFSPTQTPRCFEEGCYKFNIQYLLNQKSLVATGTATGTEFLITSFTIGNNTATLYNNEFSIGSCFTLLIPCLIVLN